MQIITGVQNTQRFNNLRQLILTNILITLAVTSIKLTNCVLKYLMMMYNWTIGTLLQYFCDLQDEVF